MKIKIGLFVTFLVFACTILYLYAYQDHRDIATEKSDYEITVMKLQAEFVENDSLANSKYQDKTIEVSGKITDIDKESKGVVVDEKLFGTFKDILPSDLATGNQIKIKGRFIGYDDLLEEFKVDQISIVK